MDQRVPRVPVEVVDLEDVLLSPRRAACLQPGVDGEPNKQWRKSQKCKREDSMSVAASIRDFATGMEHIEKLKLEITERMTLRILEAEGKSRKSTLEGQLTLASLFLNAIKQQGGQRAPTQSNESADVSSKVLQMPTLPTLGIAPVYSSPTQSPPAQTLSYTPSADISTPTPRTTVYSTKSSVDVNAATTLPSSSASAEDIAPEMPPRTPPACTVPDSGFVGMATDQATSTPPPLTEGTCW
jgi:hypothetical protein